MTALVLPDNPTYRIAISRFALTAKIPQGDPFWHAFNGSFVKHSLGSADLACAIYDGKPFTTWHKNNWRKNENYECGQHLGLDFDTEDARSTLAALMQNLFIQRYASIIYTTPSHTPEKPRARVVFLLDEPIRQARNYALAAQALLWLFGAADRQCKEPCRFFYGSRGCEMELLANVLPLDKVKQLIGQYQESGQRAMRQQRGRIEGTADQAEVIAALARVSPWSVEYDDWVRILMALHAEYGDAGLTIAEQWADGDGDEVARKWRGFRPQGNTTGAVSIGTLFAIAKQHGWQKAA